MLATRPLSTTIRMSASHYDVRSIDMSRGEDVLIDLTGSSPTALERISATLCQLHGIGTRKQWAKHGNYLKKEAAARAKASRQARKEHAAEREAVKKAIAQRRKRRVNREEAIAA